MKRISLERLPEVQQEIQQSNLHIINALRCSMEVGDKNTIKLVLNLPVVSKILQNPEAMDVIFPHFARLVRDDKHLELVKYIINRTKNAFTKYAHTISKDTALHEACSYGAQQTVGFLLTKGADVNAVDVDGRTPLHRATERNRIEVVRKLIEFKPSFDVLTTSKLSPLHITVLLGLKEMQELLVWEGANPNFKGLGGLDCSGMQQAALSGEIQIQLPDLPPRAANPKLKYYQGMAKAYKGILSKKGYTDCLVEAVDTLISFFKITTEEELKLSIIDVLSNIHTILDYSNNNELYSFLTDCALSIKNNKLLAKINCDAALKKLDLADYFTAIKFLDEAYIYLEKFPNDFETPDKVCILYNFLKAYMHIDSDKFFLYSAKLEELDPSHQDHLKMKFMFQRETNPELAKQTIEKMQDSDEKAICYKLLWLDNPGTKKLTTENEGKQPPTLLPSWRLGLSLEEHYQQKNYPKALEAAKAALECSKPFDIPVQLVTVLALINITESPQEGINLLDKSNKDFPDVMQNHTLPSLKFMECMFYSQGGNFKLAFNSLNFLVANSNIGEIVSFCTYNSMSIFLSSILGSGNLDNIRLYCTELFSAEAAEQILLKLSQPVSDNITDTQDTDIVGGEEVYMDWVATQPKELQEAFTTLDYNKINAYYQKKKQDISQHNNYQVTLTSFTTSWQIGDNSFNNENVCKIEGKPHFYAVIEPGLFSSLETTHQKQCTSALPKGVVGSGEGQTGSRFIKGKLVELKINNGPRLYTDTLYKNNKGDYLVLYKCLEKKHDNMGGIINHSQMKIVDVLPCSFEDQVPLELVGDIFLEDN